MSGRLVLELVLGGVALVACGGFGVLVLRRRASLRAPRDNRILLPFAGGAVEQPVLDAAIRIARAEDATLVAAYLLLTPREYALDTPLQQQVSAAVPLLEAVEHASLRAGVPVDARIESGRTRVHALERLWSAERFHRIVVPAPVNGEAGFTAKDVLWILGHAPSQTLVLRPEPEVTARSGPGGSRTASARPGLASRASRGRSPGAVPRSSG